MASTQSPRYSYSPIWARQPLKLPNGNRLAAIIYLNVEHFPYDTPEIAYHFLNARTTQTAPDVLNHSWRDYGMRVGLWRVVEVIEYGVSHGWEWIGHGVDTGSVVAGMDEVLFEESADSARIMAISLHPFTGGDPFRIRQLDRALKHIASKGNVWLAQAHEVSDWYRETWPEGHLNVATRHNA
jgi:peptidoglycan/xylan/chitin deacetylase (PgdA/CDA1 family)